MIESLANLYVVFFEPFLWPLLKIAIFFVVVMAVIWLVAFLREIDNVVVLARKTMAVTWQLSVGSVMLVWWCSRQVFNGFAFVGRAIFNTLHDFFAGRN